MIKAVSAVQRNILTFIDNYSRTRGYSPSIKEIMTAAGYTSPASVHHHLVVLEARKLITRGKPAGAQVSSPRTVVVTDAGRQSIITGKCEV